MQKIVRTHNIQRIIYGFKSSKALNKMVLNTPFLTRVLYDCFKIIYAYLNEGNNVRECYNCLKMMMQVSLRDGFFTIYFSLYVHDLNDSIYR